MSDQNRSANAPAVAFGVAIAGAFRNYAQFNGRARVSEFWWFALFLGLVSAGLAAFGGLFPDADRTSTALTQVWSIATVLPTLAVSVRRLRDGGNAWAQLLWILVPVAGLVIVAIRLCDPSVSSSDGGTSAESREEPGTRAGS
jgi:uncharacterized membrane protein YhaH (DUF805 family)